ncbi:MAG: ATP-binding domain-containing protein, partial [Xanthomonadales bacterium]|nr:ATP-binding domain-containing protein [Xanthomonadales bacterium]
TGCSVPSTANASAFADAVVELRDSHRFGADSGLGLLSTAIRAGDAVAVIDGLRAERFADVTLESSDKLDPAAAIVRRYGQRFAALAAITDPAQALLEAEKLRVLTALRVGPSGCIAINAAMETYLRQQAAASDAAQCYAGRLLLITENDYGNDLFNGDIGIVLAAADQRLYAWFPAADGGVRRLPLSILPAHDSAFAMTIHKSQGSEFDEVAIVLPPEDARVLSRELLYTAVTRAKSRVVLFTDEAALTHALQRSSRRYSGLVNALTT